MPCHAHLHPQPCFLQGSAQCCVTGRAFEQMLQQADATTVQAVMRSVAVFARMRGPQKGQVMDLLQRRGLYHTLHGQQHHLSVSPPPLHPLPHPWKPFVMCVLPAVCCKLSI